MPIYRFLGMRNPFLGVLDPLSQSTYLFWNIEAPGGILADLGCFLAVFLQFFSGHGGPTRLKFGG